MKNHIITALFILVAYTLTAQDIYKDALYTSESVLKFGKEIGLSDSQTAKIKELYKQNTTEFKELKEKLNQAQDSLRELLNNSQVDEGASLKKLGRINELERKLKYVRLQMLIRIKNEISDTQQQELEKALQKDGDSWSFNTSDQKDTRIVIKGNASKTGVQPLYIVDGRVVKDFNVKTELLDPDKIESVNVLKGQSATSLYGKEGENGVIVIKLKKQ